MLKLYVVNHYHGKGIVMKITFMGAGSTIFVKNVIGDSLLSEALCDSEIALYDIDENRANESLAVVSVSTDSEEN